jgi:orotate phosphoribosyltransferase
MLVEMTARKHDFPERERLREIIKIRSFEEGSFTLSSGKKSDVFFNLKPTMLDPEGINLLADQVIDRIKGYKADYIGGLAMGAVPVLISVIVKSHNTPHQIKGFWVRKEQKHHGMQQLIDGDLEPNSKVVIVEDVTTTGQSVLRAVEEARERGCTISCILTVIDRCEGAKETLRDAGYELISLFDRYDFTDKKPDEID